MSARWTPRRPPARRPATSGAGRVVRTLLAVLAVLAGCSCSPPAPSRSDAAHVVQRRRGRGHVRLCNVPLNVAESPQADRKRAGDPRAHRPGPDQGRDQGPARRRVRRERPRRARRRRLRPRRLPRPDRARRSCSRCSAAPAAPLAPAARRPRRAATDDRRRHRRCPRPTPRALDADLARYDAGAPPPAASTPRSSPPSRSASCRSSPPACCRSSPATCARSRASTPEELRGEERPLGQVLGPAIIFCLSFTVMFVALGHDARPASARRCATTRTLLNKIAGWTDHRPGRVLRRSRRSSRG